MLPILAALSGPALAALGPAAASAAPALGAAIPSGLFSAAAGGASQGALAGLAGGSGFQMPSAVLQSGGASLPTSGFQMPSMFRMGGGQPSAQPVGGASGGGDSQAADAARAGAERAMGQGQADVSLARPTSGYRAPTPYQSNFQPTSPMFGRKAAFYAGR